MEVLVFINAVLIGVFISLLFGHIFGDKPFTRLLKVIFIPIVTLSYIYFMFTPTSANIPMMLIAILMFGPIGLFIIMLIIFYIFKK